MTFDLSDELISNIISAMDNQDSVFVVDAANAVLVEKQPSDEERYYGLPEWNSADGFEVRESFVNQLHSPLVREELQNVLHSGRGVFKNFRNVLKEYPEIDKRWHIYKHRMMSARINEWYNSLREIWGLEKLDQFTETDDELVHDDFSFKEYNSSEDDKKILLNISVTTFGDEDLPSEVNNAVYGMWRNQFLNGSSTEQSGYVCYSFSEEFAGCITASPCLSKQDKIMFLTSLFVPESFRGLGICTELISMYVAKLQSDGKKWLIIPQSITPEILQPLLIRTGFKKISSGYLLSLGD